MPQSNVTVTGTWVRVHTLTVVSGTAEAYGLRTGETTAVTAAEREGMTFKEWRQTWNGATTTLTDTPSSFTSLKVSVRFLR